MEEGREKKEETEIEPGNERGEMEHRKIKVGVAKSKVVRYQVNLQNASENHAHVLQPSGECSLCLLEV